MVLSRQPLFIAIKCLWYGWPPMKKPPEDKPANLNLRNIPRTTFFRLKMAAAAEQCSVKEFVLELIETKIQELEKKGLLPKVK